MLKILEHPMILTKLTTMRHQETSHKEFRALLEEISSLMAYEILRDYKTKPLDVPTPTGSVAHGAQLDKDIIIVPILRAGLGMVQGILNLVPEAKVGHIGLYRDETTFEAKEYFYKMPEAAKDSEIFVVDPMLATGHSSSDAINLLKKNGFTHITLVCLVGVQEGIDFINKNHPDVKIFLAAKDDKLNDKKYILPGLGDAGDRIFGTK